MTNNKLTDESSMPFGKYRGKQMADVPADYLLWLYDNCKCSDNVHDYIIDNLEVLKKNEVKYCSYCGKSSCNGSCV